MTDRELLELIATQVNRLTKEIDVMTKEIDVIKNTMAVKEELAAVKNIVTRIENEHGQKLTALFDGYKINSEKLDRIENEVSKHEEIILRRVR